MRAAENGGEDRGREKGIVGMSSNPSPLRPIVLYVPAGGRSTARIPRGSAVVAQPRCGAHKIEVCFEGADRNYEDSSGWSRQAQGGCVAQLISPARLPLPWGLNCIKDRDTLDPML